MAKPYRLKQSGSQPAPPHHQEPCRARADRGHHHLPASQGGNGEKDSQEAKPPHPPGLCVEAAPASPAWGKRHGNVRQEEMALGGGHWRSLSAMTLLTSWACLPPWQNRRDAELGGGDLTKQLPCAQTIGLPLPLGKKGQAWHGHLLSKANLGSSSPGDVVVSCFLFPSLSFGVDRGGDENCVARGPFPAKASPWPEYPGEAGHRHLASFPAPGRLGSWQAAFLPLIQSPLTQNEQDPECEENHGKGQAANPEGLVV